MGEVRFWLRLADGTSYIGLSGHFGTGQEHPRTDPRGRMRAQDFDWLDSARTLWGLYATLVP